ncbi:MAG: HIT domain-containing protein [Gammaproteobacteria bacterium]
MPEFVVHPRLLADCHQLGRLALCRVLLHRNAALPWFILVPEVGQEIVELHELDGMRRQQLATELDLVARFTRARFDVAKLNIAAIGNIVQQLHVHVVGRHPDDPCWPGVVWGRLPPGPAWDSVTLQELVERLAPLGLTPVSG